MANTTILLREDVDALGGRGEIVKVKAGYARNYLLPHGIATLATKGNVRQIELEREALLKKAAIEKATAEAQREQMESIALSFARKSGEAGTLFGSVTSMDIADALKEKGYEVDRKRVVLRDPIKEMGEYTVKVKLHREVTLDVPVRVTNEDGEIAPKIVEEKTEKKPRKAKAKSDDAEAETAATSDTVAETPVETESEA